MFRQLSKLVQPAACQVRLASTKAIIKPELQVFGVAGRHAHALFSAASHTKNLDKVEKEVQKVKSLIASDSAFALFLNNPTFSRTQKTEEIKRVSQSLKFSDTTTNFLASLGENNRLPQTVSIIDAFEALMSSQRGEVLCTVTSAADLTAAQTKEVQGALQGFVKAGQTLKATFEVNPTILGGIVVDIGDKHVDLSIATKVKKLTNLIKEPL